MMRSLAYTLACYALLAPASYLVLSAGLGSMLSDSKIAKNVLESKGEGYCSPSGPIENTLCAYETIEVLNKDLYPTLNDLVQSDFFKHYKVSVECTISTSVDLRNSLVTIADKTRIPPEQIDLYRECPFWHENGFCMNRDCGVENADEAGIPEKWSAKVLSQVHVDDEHSLPGCDLHGQDFCYTDHDSYSEGQYVDLTLNPERFTGYAGASAHRVWNAIYEENCFGMSERTVVDEVEGGVRSVPKSKAKTSGWRGSVGRAVKGLVGPGGRVVRGDEECVEKRMYYRIISGLHASISIHICHDYLDQTTGEWHPNLECFISRLASHPDRLANVYFNAVLLLRAIARAAPYLAQYDIETSIGLKDFPGLIKDREAAMDMRTILDIARKSGGGAFDEKEMFQGADATELRDEFKYNFRNVSRILDCIGCDKCRLWGKLQVSGLATALKILFELDDQALDPTVNPNLLQRSEVVALFNTMHRISESLAAVDKFRQLYALTQAQNDERESASAQQASVTSVVELTPTNATLRPRKKRKAVPSPPPTLIEKIKTAAREYIKAFRDNCKDSLSRCLQQIEKSPLRLISHMIGDRLHGTEGKRKGDL